MAKVTVTISGPVGCGKSAIMGEILIALRAVGVPVHIQGESPNANQVRGEPDWINDLDIYKPSVVLVEKIDTAARR